MALFLSDKKDAGSCTIKNVTGTETHRLLEMGITPGLTIEVIRSAPLGFPIEINVRGSSLSLREAEARCIEIES